MIQLIWRSWKISKNWPVSNEEKNKYLEPIELNNKIYVRIGKTYNVKKDDIKVGDIVAIIVAEVKKTEKDGKIEYNWDNPIFHGKDVDKKEPYDIKTIDKIAEAKRGWFGKDLNKSVSKKEVKEETRGETADEFWKNNWWKYYPQKVKEDFVLQQHLRGLTEEESKKSLRELLQKENLSTHGDLRMKYNGALFGFTIFYGEAKDVRDSGGDRLTGIKKDEKLRGTFKLLQPVIWLNLPDGYVSAPQEIGATTNKYAKFFKIDKGKYEAGVWNRHFFEFFFNGNKLKGRYIISSFPTDKGRVWNIYKPEDQKPFAETHDFDKYKEELKKKGHKYFYWKKPGEKAKFIDLTKKWVDIN